VRRLSVMTLTVLAALLTAAPVASAHQGNPNMESVVRAITPRTEGVSIQVLSRDDRFELTNRSSQPIVIYGYNDEPYARLLPDGTVEQNTRSPAYYLNQERDASVVVPKTANAKAPPTWKVLDKTGRFQWHDHRMHYMGKGVPPSVKDESRRQKIDDYTIPIKIGSSKGAIAGTLWWTPQSGGGAPVGAIVAFVLLVGLGLGAVVLKRRRQGPGDDRGEGENPRERPAPVEAW
jgi:hypothetical protein